MMIRTWLVCLGATLLLLSPGVAAAEFDFAGYGQLLEQHLSQGQSIAGIPANTVDYAALAEDPQWPRLLGTLAGFDPATLTPRDERMAFWINVYNIAAIKTVVDHWPVDSIRSRKINWLASPWGREAILVGGEGYSLKQIEFDLLVEGFHDLRVHLGINCASASCVDLLPQPYRAGHLDQQLQQQGERFAAQQQKGLRIDRATSTVYVSKIFEFDAEHFDSWGGGAVRFLLPYVTDAGDRSYLQQGDFRLSYLDYNWSLNNSRGSQKP